MNMKHKKTVFFVVLMFVFVSISYAVTSNENNRKYEKPDFENEQPAPPVITGPDCAKLGEDCKYKISSVDPQGDSICYKIMCSDMPAVYVSEMCCSGEEIEYCHCWDDFYQKSNPFTIKAQAIDDKGFKSEWTCYSVTVEGVIIDNPIIENLYRFDLIYNFISFLLNLFENIFPDI